jgi:cell division protein FtsZ
MGIGRAAGENRAAEAARQAIASPLLEISITGAQGILFNVTGGAGLGLFEVNEAAEIIKETADSEANIIFGTVIDERMGDDVMITVIATGFDSNRRRDAAAAVAPVEAGAGLRVGRENRDFLRELEEERAATPAFTNSHSSPGMPVMEAADEQLEPTRPRVETAPRKPAYETEDLDIPAFLRRNR